ncbi:hypothetical protein [Empedobacter falsenii]|nr:hypothetical protein [Flavobacteriaceae bacterium]
MKVNPILILFAIIYNIITGIFILNILDNQSASLEYALIIFPIFWIISGIILYLLARKKIIDFKGIINKILLFLSTPLALLLFQYIFIQLTDAKYVVSSREYDNGNNRYQEVIYDYEVAVQTQRKEFYILNGGWNKDSIWIYYNKDGSIEKTVDYRKK